MITKKQILAIEDIKTEEVFIPEWNDSVLIRGLSGNQRDDYESSIVEMRGKTQIIHLQQLRAKLASLTIVDENGNRMFDSDEVDELGKKSAAALDRIVQVAQRLSGLTQEDMDKLAKNSVSEPKEDSGFDSRLP